MPIQDQQIKEAVKNPSKKSVINRAIAHEERIKFHCELALEENRVSKYKTDFSKWAHGLLKHPDKIRTFNTLNRVPVKTIPETEKIFESIAKVFDGQNPVYRADFIIPEDAQDWEAYRDGDMQRWKEEGMAKLKLAINSIVIVDVPSEQLTSLPEPYFYFLPISHVIDFEEVGKEFKWIVFRVDDDHIMAIDDNSYRLIYHPKKDVSKYEIKSQAFHVPEQQGKCPVKFFWDTAISDNDRCIKLSPVSPQLPALDKLLFDMIGLESADLYSIYPIIWSYDSECDYTHETEGYYAECKGGLLSGRDGKVIHLGNGDVALCPACSAKNLTGPGTHLKVPRPEAGQGGADMREPAGFISPNVDSLKLKSEWIKEQRINIHQDVTGYGGEPTNDQAVNEKQIIAAFESRTGVLRNIKKNFEKIIQWVDETRCRIRYGDSFLSINVDMGTDFYLYDADYILDLYGKVKLAGGEISILDFLLDLYYSTKFRNNPEALERYNIEKNIVPYRHLSRDEIINLNTSKIITDEELQIILNYPNFVKRFEREQANILEFGKNLPFDKKIEKIIHIIKSYAHIRPDGGEGNPNEGANSTGKKQIAGEK